MISFDDYYHSNHSRDHVCPNCGYTTYNDSHCDSYYKEPEPEPEIIQHDHPKLWQKRIGNLVQFYMLPLYNRKLLFCVSGYLPKRIKRIRKD